MKRPWMELGSRVNDQLFFRVLSKLIKLKVRFSDETAPS